jgi:hypothetical protein
LDASLEAALAPKANSACHWPEVSVCVLRTGQRFQHLLGAGTSDGEWKLDSSWMPPFLMRGALVLRSRPLAPTRSELSREFEHAVVSEAAAPAAGHEPYHTGDKATNDIRSS